MILKPFQRIKIIESDKKCKAGSLGYFVTQDPVSVFNGWEMAIVFTRFGKKGKPRVDLLKIETYMFDYENFRKSEKDIIEVVKYAEQIEPRQDVRDRGKRRQSHTLKIGGTKLKPVEPEVKNLLELDNTSFMAYICAMSLYIYSISPGCEINQLVMSSGRHYGINLSRFAEGGFRLHEAKPELVGFFILNGLKFDLAKADNVFRNAYESYFSDLTRRRHLLERLILTLCSMTRAIKEYNEFLDNQYKGRSSRINDVIIYYRKNKRELKEIKEAEAELTWGNYVAPRLQGKSRRSLSHKQKRLEEIEEIEVVRD